MAGSGSPAGKHWLGGRGRLRTAGCAALYALSIAALLLGPLGRGWGFVDLAVYRYGGQGVLDHAHLYELRFPGALAFTYPPIAALCFTVLRSARMAILEPIVTLGNLALTPLMLFFALRLRPIGAWLEKDRALRLSLIAAAAAIWSEPLWTTLRYGQIDILVATLILFDLSRSDASRLKGVGTGLAIALKLTPAIFTLYMLLTRRYRAAAVSLAVFAVTVAVGFLATPGDSREYWGGAFFDSRRVGRIENAANQALRGAWARLMHSVNVQPEWLCTAVVVGVVGIALAAASGRSGDDARGFSLCAVTGLLISPVSWSHHWVAAVAALTALAVGAVRAASKRGLYLCGAAALVACSHVIWWVPVNRPRHSELRLDPLQLVYADAYVILGLAGLAFAGGSALRAWRSSGRSWRSRTRLSRAAARV